MDYDSPWKDAIEIYFEQCMALFFPEIHKAIDWSRKPEFLDKEFQKITRQSEDKRRYVDKLVKAYLRQGGDIKILFHIEAQNQPDIDFPERMYIYNYRIFDRYKYDVVSLGILGDTNPKYRPDRYQRNRFGCNLSFIFPIVKLTDFAKKRKSLQQSDNPFALFVMAHIKAQECKDNQERKESKFTLIKHLLQSGHKRKDIVNLLSFIDWLIDLPEEMEQELQTELDEIMEEDKMEYVTSWERMGEKRGEKRGEKKGEMNFFTRLLDKRFGPLSEKTQGKCQQATPEMLDAWGMRLLSANSIDEVFGNNDE